MRPNIKSRDMYHDGLKSTTWIRICASSSRFVRYFFKQYRLRWFRDTSFPLKRHTFKCKKTTHRRRCEWPRIRITFVVPPRISTLRISSIQVSIILIIIPNQPTKAAVENTCCLKFNQPTNRCVHVFFLLSVQSSNGKYMLLKINQPPNQETNQPFWPKSVVASVEKV